MREDSTFVRAVVAIALAVALAFLPVCSSPAETLWATDVVVEVANQQPLPATTTTDPAVRPLAVQPHAHPNTRHHQAPVSSSLGSAPATALSPDAAVAPKSGARVASNDILATPGRLQRKLARWREVSGADPTTDMAVWSRQYNTIRQNYARGKWREWVNQRLGLGSPGSPLWTPAGERIPDAVEGVVLREFKDGAVSFTPFVRRQMFKDYWLMRHAGRLPEWHFYGDVSPRVLSKLETYGIPYFRR